MKKELIIDIKGIEGAGRNRLCVLISEFLVENGFNVIENFDNNLSNKPYNKKTMKLELIELSDIIICDTQLPRDFKFNV